MVRCLLLGVLLVLLLLAAKAIPGFKQDLEGRPSTDGDPQYIARYPPLQQLRRGQTKADVHSILGPAKRKLLNPTIKRCPVGHTGRKDRTWEEWIYAPEGWHGGIEVDFDAGGKVRSFGYGFG